MCALNDPPLLADLYPAVRVLSIHGRGKGSELVWAAVICCVVVGVVLQELKAAKCDAVQLLKWQLDRNGRFGRKKGVC